MTTSDLFQSCYYNNLFSEIFEEIKMQLEGKPRELIPGFGFVKDREGKDQSAYRLSLGKEGRILLSVKEQDKQEIKSRVEKLLLNPDLIDLTE